eukprot:4589400-Pyramimonas_sp.AAC.1
MCLTPNASARASPSTTLSGGPPHLCVPTTAQPSSRKSAGRRLTADWRALMQASSEPTMSWNSLELSRGPSPTPAQAL